MWKDYKQECKYLYKRGFGIVKLTKDGIKK